MPWIISRIVNINETFDNASESQEVALIDQARVGCKVQVITDGHMSFANFMWWI